MGICISGHIAFRAANEPRRRGRACFYREDTKSVAAKGMHDDTLDRMREIKAKC